MQNSTTSKTAIQSMQQNLSFERLVKLQQTHPTWRLLTVDNGPLILSFCYQTYIQPNCRSLPVAEFISKLDDTLYHLRSIYGEDCYPKAAKAYLDDWSNQHNQFFRQYYVDNSDMPQVDLTPTTEKALEWLQELENRQFIGTESRLLQLYRSLKDLVYKSEQDPAVRISELERQQVAIDIEIQQLKSGIINPYDSRQVKEAFLNAEDMSRKLLSDFGQIEYNFRELDRNARERIALSDKNKGALLEEIFAEQDIIQDSDQGRSFKAFWEFLMSSTWQNELQELLASVFSLPEVHELSLGSVLKHIDRHLIQAGEKVYKTNNLLAEQLRKYLDSQAFLENKRIMELIKDIEKQAVILKHDWPTAPAMCHIDDTKPNINLIMSRSLFTPPKNPTISEQKLMQGQADMDFKTLFQQTYIDEQELLANIRHALQRQPQISLKQLLELFPIKKGLAEVVTYLHIANKDPKAVINKLIMEDFMFATANNRARKVELPQIIFTR